MRSETTSCPICDADVRVRHEPAEPAGMGGYYPGGSFVDSYSCDCAKRLDEGDAPEAWSEEFGIDDLEEYRERIFDSLL